MRKLPTFLAICLVSYHLPAQEMSHKRSRDLLKPHVSTNITDRMNLLPHLAWGKSSVEYTAPTPEKLGKLHFYLDCDSLVDKDTASYWEKSKWMHTMISVYVLKDSLRYFSDVNMSFVDTARSYDTHLVTIDTTIFRSYSSLISRVYLLKKVLLIPFDVEIDKQKMDIDLEVPRSYMALFSIYNEEYALGLALLCKEFLSTNKRKKVLPVHVRYSKMDDGTALWEHSFF